MRKNQEEIDIIKSRIFNIKSDLKKPDFRNNPLILDKLNNHYEMLL